MYVCMYIYIYTWQTIPISASTGRWIRRLLVSPIASTQKATRRAEAGPYNGGSAKRCRAGVGWGNNVQTCCVHVMQNMGVKGNHPHVLHNFASRVPNTTDGPQQNWWNGWSTVACWMTPHDKFLLLRAMSLQNDAWYVPSKVGSFCSSKLQQNKNQVKHRRFEKHVRAKLPARRVLWGYLKSPQQSVNTKSWSWLGWFGVQLF